MPNIQSIEGIHANLYVLDVIKANNRHGRTTNTQFHEDLVHECWYIFVFLMKHRRVKVDGRVGMICPCFSIRTDEQISVRCQF